MSNNIKQFKMNNWINQQNNPQLSTKDKLKELLSSPHKLVLVQQHELERIRKNKHTERHIAYIDGLYTHYITLGLPKTYLC